MAEQSVPDSGDVFLTPEIGQKVFDAARECYERWRTTPNRDAYVGMEIERAARAAVAAIAADLMAAGRAQALLDVGEAMSPTGEWPPEALGEVVDAVRRLVDGYERGRAQAAADIRAADTDGWPGGRQSEVDGCQEAAARIAEGPS